MSEKQVDPALQCAALLIVDVQNDFLPDGSLAVPSGNEVIAPLNRWLERFRRAGRPIFLSRDWHPADHCSFDELGGPWPPHCIADTPGAAFAADLQLDGNEQVVSKATSPTVDAYSAFQGTDLALRLQRLAIEELYVGGLATDYCVLQTVLDALDAGFRVLLLTAAIRAVNVKAGDGERAIEQMRAAGATLLETERLP